VLEAEGTVEIKFRHRDILATMARTDAVYIELQEKVKRPGVLYTIIIGLIMSLIQYHPNAMSHSHTIK